jgi:hypothetical protein
VPGVEAHPWGESQDPEQERIKLPGGKLAEEYARVNHLNNAVLPQMHRLRVAPGGTHTVWLDRKNKPTVIWTFCDTVLPYDWMICDLESGERFQAVRRLPLQAGHVYQIEGSKRARR